MFSTSSNLTEADEQFSTKELNDEVFSFFVSFDRFKTKSNNDRVIIKRVYDLFASNDYFFVE